MPTSTIEEKALQAQVRLRLNEIDRKRYQKDPVAFAEQRLGLKLTEDQKAVLVSVRDKKRTFVKAANGVGKTFIASVVVAWMMECFENTKVITTAPTFKQVKLLLWSEIRARIFEARPRLRGKITDKSPDWSVSHDHFAVGVTATKEDNFKGMHSKGMLLLVLDEGAGVPEYIYTAVITMLKGKNGRLLTIGNPTTTSGSFFKAFHESSKVNSTLSMSARTHPNVVAGLAYFGITWEQFIDSEFEQYELPDDYDDPFPGAVSLADIYIAREEFGIGTPLWEVVIEGNFPSGGLRSVIPLSWVEEARRAEEDRMKDRRVASSRVQIPRGLWAGCDVARLGDDRTVLVLMEDSKVVRIEQWRGLDLVFTARKIAADAINQGYVVNIDTSGNLGAGVVDTLTADGYHEGRDFRSNNASSTSDDPKRFMRMRDQLWFDVAELFRAGALDLSLLSDKEYDELRSELTAVEQADLGPRGQSRVEKKEDTKKRLRRSPDVADAFNLACHRPRLSTPPIIIRKQGADAIMVGVLTERY